MTIADVAYNAYVAHMNGCGVELPAFYALSLEEQEAWSNVAQAVARETIDEFRRQIVDEHKTPDYNQEDRDWARNK